MSTITIPAPVQSVRTDFENASSVETSTLAAGTYPVEFTDVRGNVTDREGAYYAVVKVPATEVIFSYKWVAARPAADYTRHLRLYAYEFEAGKDFWVRGTGGATVGFTPVD